MEVTADGRLAVLALGDDAAGAHRRDVRRHRRAHQHAADGGGHPGGGAGASARPTARSASACARRATSTSAWSRRSSAAAATRNASGFTVQATGERAPAAIARLDGVGDASAHRWRAPGRSEGRLGDRSVQRPVKPGPRVAGNSFSSLVPRHCVPVPTDCSSSTSRRGRRRTTSSPGCAASLGERRVGHAGHARSAGDRRAAARWSAAPRGSRRS